MDAVLALENGTVQLVQWSDVEFFDVQRFKSQKNLEFTTKGYEYFAPHQWLEMNNRVAPMNDKRFRQAVMHLIDRDAMNKVLNKATWWVSKLESRLCSLYAFQTPHPPIWIKSSDW